MGVLINQYRGIRNDNELEWSTALHGIAFGHSYEMGDEIVTYGYDGMIERWDMIQRRVNGAQSHAEVVGRSSIKPVSKSVEAQFETWKNRADTRTKLEGDWTHYGIGVYEVADSLTYYTLILAKIK